MNCMRCGQEIEAGQVFCPECLAEMEKYPVKPGIAIQLPKDRDASSHKKAAPRRRVLPPEEQIKRLRRMVRGLSLLLAASLVAIILLLYPMISQLVEDSQPKPGQNYSSVSDGTSEPAE